MPFRSLFSSPPKKHCKERKEAQEKQCSRKKFDPNLLKQLGDDQSRIFETMKCTKSLKPSSLPYSKNFGSFDITWCVADDSRRVVLVEYADRSFINGQPIVLSSDGKVMDSEGHWDVKMQDYYDRALMIKENRESGSKTSIQVEQVGDSNLCEQAIKDTTMLLRTLSDTNRNSENLQFDKQLLELEDLFEKIITKCSNPGLSLSLVDLSEIWDKPIEDISQLAARNNSTENTLEYDQQKIATVLERMVDQFRSMVEMSSAFHLHSAGGKNGDDTILSDTECVSIMDSSWSITDDFKQLGISRSILSLKKVSEKSPNKKYKGKSFQRDNFSMTAYKDLDECDDYQNVNVVGNETRTICPQTSLEESLSISDGSEGDISRVSATDSIPISIKYSSQNPDQQCIEAKNHVLQNEIIRLRTRNDELCCNVRQLTDDNLKFTGEAGKLKRENEDLNKRLRNSQQSKSTLDQNMRDLERRIVELETIGAGAEKQNLLLSSQLEDANNECVSAKSKLRTLERESNDQQKLVAKLKGETSMYQKESERLQLNILELQSRLSTTMAENTQNLVELGNLKKDNNDKQIEFLQLRTKLQKVEDANASYFDQKCALESEIERLVTSLNQAAKKVEHLQQQTDGLDNENKSLLTGKADAQKRVEQLEKRCIDLEIELNEEKRKVDALIIEHSNLEDIESTLRDENKKLKISINELSEINEQLRSKLYKFEKGSTELECKFSRLVEAKGDLQNVIRQLSHVNLNIEQRFKRMDSEYIDLECRLHNMDKLTTEYGQINWGDQLGCNITPVQEAMSPRQ